MMKRSKAIGLNREWNPGGPAGRFLRNTLPEGYF